jgi:flagellar basal-body rod modification protein FlgD
MAVDGVGSSTSTPQSQTPKQTAETINYDAFLKLLTAQMQYQDPTKPMDSAQLMAQLASFSNVEQGVKMNAKLDSLLISQSLSQVDGLMGKYVTSMDGKTKGVVKEVHIYANGTVVKLDSGKELLLDAGVKISEPPTAEAPDETPPPDDTDGTDDTEGA